MAMVTASSAASVFYPTTEITLATSNTFDGNTTESESSTSPPDTQVITGFDTAFLLYVGCLMVIGILGNLTVFVVFLLRFPHTSYRTFVLCLAALDFLMCCFGMPKTIMLIRYKEVFNNIATCKSIVFIVKYLAGSSVIILIVIALDRYWKVCHPTKAKVRPFHPNVAVVITLSTVFVLISPSLVLYGEWKTVNGATVTTCTVPDKYTKFNKAFEGILLILLLIIFAILILSYSMIGRQIIKRTKVFGTKTPVSAKDPHAVSIKLDNSSTTGVETTNESSLSETNLERQASFKPTATNGEVNFVKVQTNEKVKNTKSSKNKRQGKTYILFIVTLITMCSWIPHFALELIQASNPDFFSTVTPGILFICRFFFFSYYWNTIANPFLYGICDMKFKIQLKSIASKIFNKCFQSRKTYSIPR